jgi:hypothetical protein
MAVTVSAGPAFAVPQVLFQTRVPSQGSVYRTNYVPAGDGRRFLLNTSAADAGGAAITITLNWIARLSK